MGANTHHLVVTVTVHGLCEQYPREKTNVKRKNQMGEIENSLLSYILLALVTNLQSL